MKRIQRRWLRSVAVCLTALVLSVGCDDSGGGSKPPPDVGDNDINVVVAIGDSITEGRCVPAGAPWPSRLAGLAEKTVINEGRCGERSSQGAARIGGVLARYKPGYVLINYGANDALDGRDVDFVASKIRVMIQAAKGNQSVPLVGTVLPTYGSRAFANSRVDAINVAIRQVASEEGVRVVDLNREFGDNEGFLQEDGLHPSDSGNQLIALSFNDRIR